MRVKLVQRGVATSVAMTRAAAGAEPPCHLGGKGRSCPRGGTDRRRRLPPHPSDSRPPPTTFVYPFDLKPDMRSTLYPLL